MYRRQGRDFRFAAGRPVAIKLHVFTVPLGGRSRAQRTRDDSIHAEYLAWLERMKARARARRDSAGGGAP